MGYFFTAILRWFSSKYSFGQKEHESILDHFQFLIESQKSGAFALGHMDKAHVNNFSK